MAHIAEIVGVTIALAASDGAAVAPPDVPTSGAGSTSPIADSVAMKRYQVSWSLKLIKRHVNVMTDAAILFDFAQAINQLVLELDNQLVKIADLSIGLEEIVKAGRVLRNALQIEAKMHQKSNEPTFDDTRLAKAYNDMITAFEHFDRHLQSLEVKGF